MPKNKTICGTIYKICCSKCFQSLHNVKLKFMDLKRKKSWTEEIKKKVSNGGMQ